MNLYDIQVEEGWWRGRLNGKVGVFPSNFVEIIPTQSPVSANRQSVNNVTPVTNSMSRNNKSNSSLNNSREDILSISQDATYEAPLLPPKPSKKFNYN